MSSKVNNLALHLAKTWAIPEELLALVTAVSESTAVQNNFKNGVGCDSYGILVTDAGQSCVTIKLLLTCWFPLYAIR